MNKMEELSRRIIERLPRAEVSIDPPAKPMGTWWLDARIDNHSVVVEWRPRTGFGVSSTPAEGYGEGPDELFDNIDDALARIVDVLEMGARTQPPSQVALRRLREARRISQVALAELMGVRQATVSKLEHRQDLNVSTLRRFVEALGGTLVVCARFKDQTIEIDVENMNGPEETVPAK